MDRGAVAVSRSTRLEELDGAVQLQRRKGDAFARRNSIDRAVEAYTTARVQADEALTLLGVSVDAGHVALAADRSTAAEAAEWLGIRGGILRRIGGFGTPDALGDALDSYRAGAAVEQQWELT